MLTMWLAMAALCLLALVFVLWPLVRHQVRAADSQFNRSEANVVLYKSHLQELEAQFNQGDMTPEVFEQLKTELGRSLLEDNQSAKESAANYRWAKPVILFSIVLVPAFSFAFYYKNGAFEALELRDLMEQQAVTRQGGAEGEMATQALVSKLEKLLQENPEDLKNWYLLARSRLELQDIKGAIAAYQEILNRSPEEPQILAEFAQVIFMASGNQMLPQVKILSAKALELQPENTLALSLAGVVAFSEKDYRNAQSYWQQAVSIMGPNSPDAQPLLAGLANIQELLGSSAGPQSALDIAQSTESTDELAVTIDVRLSANVNEDPEKVVFVYARAWQGPKMPLAIARLQVKDLPTTVTLTESMSMMAGMTIATVGDVELVARISQDGTPATKPGDWQASVGPVATADFAKGYLLTIDTLVK